MTNQCFYLSLAASYLGFDAAHREAETARKPLPPMRPASCELAPPANRTSPQPLASLKPLSRHRHPALLDATCNGYLSPPPRPTNSTRLVTDVAGRLASRAADPERQTFKVESTFSATLSRARGGLGLQVDLADTRVLRVESGSVSDEAGIRKYDRVAALNGRAITGQLGALLAAEVWKRPRPPRVIRSLRMHRRESHSLRGIAALPISMAHAWARCWQPGATVELTIERPGKKELSRIASHQEAKQKALAAAAKRGGGSGASQLRQTALRLKRILEAAVLRAHPE